MEAAYESEPQDANLFFLCEWSGAMRPNRKNHEGGVRASAERPPPVRDPSNHLIPDVEQVVSDGDRFLVVTKREGTPAEVAIQEDPRT